MEFKTQLGHYKIVKTEDGSETIYSSLFDENCHSLSGAYDETIYNYIRGCQVIEKIERQNLVTIFEVGFGLAVGIESLVEVMTNSDLLEVDQRNESPKKILFISTEIDPMFAKWALENSSFAKKYKSLFKNYTEVNSLTESYISLDLFNIHLKILLGDARHTVKTIPFDSVDCIFQDAFSPKKNPSLWTTAWFLDLIKISNDKVILSTYSSSHGVRASLLKAGFHIENRKGFGQKRTCTRAYKVPDSATPLINEEIKKILHKSLEDE